MFRYFTGAIAMATAVVILIFVIGHPANGIFPAIFLVRPGGHSMEPAKPIINTCVLLQSCF
jgi:hypothetical protein